jgi:hypothetical protein
MRHRLLLCVVGVMAITALPAASSSSAAPIPSATSTWSAPTQPTAAQGRRRGGECDQPVERDSARDGAIDIASIRITSDCTRAVVTLTTHRAFTNTDLGEWVLFLGPGPHCNGMRSAVIVSGGPQLTARLFPFIGDCQLDDGRTVAVTRLSPTSVRITLPSDALDERWPYTWFSYTTGPDGTGTDLATRFAVESRVAVPAPQVSLASTIVDGRLAVYASLPNRVFYRPDYYEVQHRRPGERRWSKAVRTTGTLWLTLTPAVVHEVRVRAVDRGRGGPWTVQTGRVLVPPSAIRNIVVTATDDRLVVEFDPPASTGGLPLKGIDVTYTPDFGGEFCSGMSLRCEFADPDYPGILSLTSWTLIGNVRRNGPEVRIAVPDPTP